MILFSWREKPETRKDPWLIHDRWRWALEIESGKQDTWCLFSITISTQGRNKNLVNGEAN